ncbi:efflux transporter outer membrane subunit [Thioclava sp. BHET1]|nr:efflux transporter outer membrane subunit [Thioclava sp. BHET1]
MKTLTLTAVLLLTGCAAVGPNFQAPTADLPSAYIGGTTRSDANAAETPWWRAYHDARLTQYIETGLSQNLSVQLAQEEIVQARAALRQTGINAAVSDTNSLSRGQSGGTGQSSHLMTNNTLSAGLVLDLFGGLRRERESAAAGVAAAQANLQVVRLQWLASMIAAYSNARYYQQAAALTRLSIHARAQTLTVTQNQYKAGGATTYEVDQARAALETARGDLPQYVALYKSNTYAIAKLLNRPAAPILAEMNRHPHQLHAPGKVSSGVPADLLRNRPDIRYQQALLHEAVAKIGVDDAAMLPSLSLSGTVTDKAGVSSWFFGPQISLPLLTHGLLSAQRDAQISAAKQAELSWRSTVTNAVSDVQVGLSNLHQYKIRAAALENSASSYSSALAQERQNYQSGAITLVDLLTVDLDATTAQINAASAVNDLALEWATLQIATGAGAQVVGSNPIPASQLTAVQSSRKASSKVSK